MPATPFHLVVAATPQGGIGRGGDLPWRLPKDMAHFVRVTSWFGRVPGMLAYGPQVAAMLSQAAGDPQPPLNAVLMGRKTWDSIPRKFRPLQGRANVVLTRGDAAARSAIASEATPSTPVHVWSGFDEALEAIAALPGPVGAIHIAGGAHIYAQALAHPLCRTVFLTRVERTDGAAIECDTFLPPIPASVFALADDNRVRELLGPDVDLTTQTHGDLQFKFMVYERRVGA
ncbi:dihydrofolate reductase [Polyrhizophydium stewartii]|uniref:Dihydrofolate reductase n=1 Tax=Polyrhizophydium stewartii TaxID=2732419 RepID=A0ABR4MZW6_9FUNG|nr:dihydrofolate reductase [Polyrhizophydium stewartii]